MDQLIIDSCTFDYKISWKYWIKTHAYFVSNILLTSIKMLCILLKMQLKLFHWLIFCIATFFNSLETLFDWIKDKPNEQKLHLAWEIANCIGHVLAKNLWNCAKHQETSVYQLNTFLWQIKCNSFQSVTTVDIFS